MSGKDEALGNMHQLLLDALRHREQEIFRYLAILGPAMGGFVWLLYAGSAIEVKTDAAGQAVTSHELGLSVFVVGTISVLLLLLLGAVYSLALGYNYRYITLQLAKLEGKLEIKQYVLEGWPGSRRQFLARYRLSRSIPRRIRRCVFGSLRRRSAYRRWLHKPWCTPPEIIKVFWWAFLAGIGGVTLAACLYRPETVVLSVVIPLGAIAFLVGLLTPWHFGKKLHGTCMKEPEDWGCSSRSVA